MSITDELRHNIKGAEQLYGRECTRLTAIADRIDVAAEGMVELPKDADDVPWNVGDRDDDGNVVTQLRLTSAGWFIITDGNWPYRPKHKRHYHAPTVEEVLTEFADEVYADADNEIRDRDFLCAKYAKRLTLAEGEDA